jgi:hypothetical protein
VNNDLNNMARSYARLSRDIGARINFAVDLKETSSDLTPLEIAEQEQLHLDKAFFVLSFAVLEREITLLASLKIKETLRRDAMRDAKFSTRWETAINVAREILGSDPAWMSAASEVKSWNEIRNEITHGEPPTQLFNIPVVIATSIEIAATLEAVNRVLNP